MYIYIYVCPVYKTDIRASARRNEVRA